MSYIKSLRLENFRSYTAASLGDLSCGPVVLYGANGAGKTNILEALSLLSPGRGLRGAKLAEMQRRETENGPWAVSAHAETSFGPVRLGTGWDRSVDKKIIRINGEHAKNQAVLSEWLSCVWLTPQMDRLFLEGSAARRRFLDRLVFAFDPGHSGRVTRYENAMGQRSKILRESEVPDSRWLDALESTMAETGVAIAAARVDFVRRLQTACDRADINENALFPKARLRAAGTIEELLTRIPALEAEELFRYQLRETRRPDAVTGGAATGPHKGDLAVTYIAKDMPASQCSTGEQKALLLGIIVAHARLIAAERGSPPVLLLDEVAAHLDDRRRAGLYDILLALGGQVWMTGTDIGLFSWLRGRASFHEVRAGGVQPAAREVITQHVDIA